MRLPFATVARVLSEDTAAVIAGAGRVEGGEIFAELTAHVPHTHIAVGAEAVIEIGDLERVPGPIPSLRIPLQLRGPSGTHLFPVMDAFLEAFPTTPNDTELAIVGEYVPPMGAVGVVADHALMHRIAADSVAELLEVVVHEIKNRRRMYERDGAGSTDD